MLTKSKFGFFLLQRIDHLFAQLLCAVVLTGIALGLRLFVAPLNAGFQYLTFFPATAFAAVLGGFRAGLAAAILAIITVFYVLTAPYFEFSAEKHAYFWQAAWIFLLDALLVISAIEWLHRYRQHYEEKARIANQALNELHAAAQKTEQILKAIPAMIFMKRAEDLSFEYINEAGEALLGLSQQTMKGKTDFDFFTPEDAEHYQQQDRAVLGAKQIIDFEIDSINTPQGVRYLKSRKVGIYDDQGNPVYLLGISMDTTEMVKRHQELHIAAATFETSDAVMICDATQHIIKVNHAFCAMSGYEAAEILGKTPRFFSSGKHNAQFFKDFWQKLTSQGEWSGEIWDRRKNGEVFPKFTRVTALFGPNRQLQGYVALYTDITAQKANEAQLQRLAFYDPLTSLPNRRLLMDRLEHALTLSERTGQYGAVIFLDLDHFKLLNDTHGHQFGDDLLQQIAARMHSTCRKSDTVSRIGGDEFVALLQELGTDHEVAQHEALLIAEKLRQRLDDEYAIRGISHRTSPSIGVCLFKGETSTAQQLLEQADSAMYTAKQAGKNRVHLY